MSRLSDRVAAKRVGMYAAQLNEHGPIRIAWSRDVPMRVKRIQADCPAGVVRLLAMRLSHPAEELAIREALAPFRHEYGKDWYRNCPQVLRFIEGW